MGRYIDKFVIFALSALAFYLFFLNAWGSIPLACILAFISCAIVNRLLRRRPVRFRCTGAQAEAEILRIAGLDDHQARNALLRLIRYRYPESDYPVECVIKHPSASVSTGDVFSLWKKRRDCDSLIIAATCISDARTMMYCRELTQPRVALIDRRRFVRIIRESGFFTPCSRLRPGGLPRRILIRICARPISGRSALFGLGLLGVYLMLGNPLYLILSVIILFMYGAALISRRPRDRLF